MNERAEIFTDGSCNQNTGVGAWSAVVLRTASGKQECKSSHEMELRALIEAAKMAEGPTTIISDHAGLISLVNRRKTPDMHKPLWDELYAATDGKDINFRWQRRGQVLGQQLAHQIARDTVRGRA